MIDTTIKLIKPASRTQDAYGVWRNGTPTIREVYAQVNSVTRAEFAAAGQAGFRPDYQIIINQAEYDQEPVCEYDGKRYAIYRTYMVPGGDYMELYVQYEAGIQTPAESD